MLVLNRRVGEVLTIGEDVSIVVVAKSKNSIRFGIEAPKDVQIHRAEVQLTKGNKNAYGAMQPTAHGRPVIRHKKTKGGKNPED